MEGLIAYALFFLTLGSIFALLSLGLNLQWGYTGLFNVGVAGFYALGAYTYALLASGASAQHWGGFEWPFPLAVIAAMVLTGTVAWLIGLATLRLRDDYLAIATIGIASTIQLIAMNAEGVTGGTQGIYGVHNPFVSLGGGQGGIWPTLAFFLLVAVTLAGVYALLERLVHSPWGRVLTAIREDEVAAASLGKNAFHYRLQSFVIGCVVMGLAGALYAAFLQYVSPAEFIPLLTFQVWAMLIVGGSGNNRGAILGAFLVWAIWSFSGDLAKALLPAQLSVRAGALQVVLIGLLLMVFLLLRPRGILGSRKAVVPSGHTVRVRGDEPPPADD